MKFLSYEKDGKEYWGVLEKDKIVEAGRYIEKDGPKTLLEFIQTGKRLAVDEQMTRIELDKVELLSPIVNPLRNIMCVGKNYRKHVMEMDRSGSDIKCVEGNPVFFTKGTNTINKPYGDIPSYQELTSLLDYEGELGVIIGKRCTNLEEGEVLENIFGYTILNDITARDIQKSHKQWFRGKSLDGTCPMGPYIVTKDEITDPQDLRIETWVNDEKRQDGNTKNMIRSIFKLISILSRGMTLEAGDIIATGTPEGVGAGFNPPKCLKKDDIIRVQIEEIGNIENLIV